MLLWASIRLDGIMTAEQRSETIARLREIHARTAAGISPLWGVGLGVMVLPTTPKETATDMAPDSSCSSSARRVCRRPTRAEARRRVAAVSPACVGRLVHAFRQQ